MDVPGYAAPSAKAPLEPFMVPRRDLGPHDVGIDIMFSGICHSDIHQAREEWFTSIFPMVPGHEISGIVSGVGTEVTKYAVGDRVGVGCNVGSCGTCANCLRGEQSYCTKGAAPTYNGYETDGVTPTYGGYSSYVVTNEDFVFRIPDSIGLDVAAPLLCAGITCYQPLAEWKAGPGVRVGIVGLGGLGHMGVKLAAAMGAEVSTLSRSAAKADDAKALGSSNHIATSDKAAMREARGSFDLILNTVSADLDMEAYLRLLRPNGALVNVGLPPSNLSVRPGSLIGGNKVISGSNIGGIGETQEMLDFCAEHGIGATVERLDASDTTTIDAAYDEVVAGTVRYRYVIDTSTIIPG